MPYPILTYLSPTPRPPPSMPNTRNSPNTTSRTKQSQQPGLDLRLQPIGPNHRPGRDHAYRLASWNVRGTYAPYDYLYVAIVTNADVFVIQEPYCPDTTDSFANWMQTEALRHGFDLYVSTHTFVYIRKDPLGRRVLEHSSFGDGRAQTFLIKFDPSEHGHEPTYAAIVGAYGYQSGTDTDPATNRGPADLFNATSDLLGRYNRTYERNLTTIIMGDLQNTIDNSPRHNGGRPRQRTGYNLLSLAEHLDLVSAVPTKHPNLTYHTRANAGLDHIAISEHLTPSITAAGIERQFVEQLLNSDHHLIFADVIFGTPSPPPPPQPIIEEIDWRAVSKIPLIREPRAADDNGTEAATTNAPPPPAPQSHPGSACSHTTTRVLLPPHRSCR